MYLSRIMKPFTLLRSPTNGLTASELCTGLQTLQIAIRLRTCRASFQGACEQEKQFQKRNSLISCIKYLLFSSRHANSIYSLDSFSQAIHISHCHHHHHVAPSARISLTVSRHFSLSLIASGRSSGLQPVSSHSCCM